MRRAAVRQAASFMLAILPELAEMRRLPCAPMRRRPRAGSSRFWRPSRFEPARLSATGVRRTLLVAALVLYAGPAQTRTFYVRTAGSDARTGRTPETAFATIGRAADELRAGDTVIVGPGRYVEGGIEPGGQGRAGEPVRFVANRDGVLTGDPPGEVLVDARQLARGFDISGAQWVTVNGFSVTNATEEGVSVKSGSDHAIVANCVVFSNGGRGIRVRDSASAIVFNNLVYANALTGIEFSGDFSGTPRAVAIGNTIYANGLARTGTNIDGLRVEGVVPARGVTVLSNVIDANRGFGINLKEASQEGFVGQWNLNTDGYNTSDVSRGALDLEEKPLFIAPAGSDGELGEDGHADDDFRLSERGAGQQADSLAVDATPFAPHTLALISASTRTDGAPETGSVNLGFHHGNESDLVSGIRESPEKRLRKLRRLAKRCDRQVARAREQRKRGRGACVRDGSRRRLVQRCGGAVEAVCL